MKLTKKAALAANEDIQGKIGFKPALDTKLKVEELYTQLYQKVLDVEIDDDDRKDLDNTTCEVIDALAAKFPDMGGEPAVEDAKVVDEKPAKKDKKEKKGKKEKASKTKKATKEETPAEKPEKPVKKAKAPKKGKKSNLAKMDAKELREHMKSMKKPEILELIDGDPILSVKADELKVITNFMSLKKNIGLVLQGQEIEVSEPKPRKKKEVAPTLRETVEAAEDFDALKAIAKDNKDSFPGVKAKKFDKVKKLRKAMLKVIVEKKRKGKTAGADLNTIRAERQKRIDWITKFIDKAGGKVGRKKLTAKALEEFPNPAKAIRDLISYAKNPKYNKFEKLMVEVDGVIGWEGNLDTTPKKSKAKKAKEEAAPAKEVKKEKKGKKDKKNKKGKKSKK